MTDPTTPDPKKVWEQVRRAVAELEGLDPDTWPTHGNVPLAITAGYAMLINENKRLRRHVHDLQSGMYVNCVYCGHRYGPADEVPVTMADALKEHIERCPEHPMSALRRRVNEAIEHLREIVPEAE